MKCVICNHDELINGQSSITLEKGTATIVFKDVPAQVCANCGEKYVSDVISKELLNKANEIYKSGVEVDVRHYQSNAA